MDARPARCNHCLHLRRGLVAHDAPVILYAAALANAVYDASGIRLRTVPFTRQRVLAALAG